MKKAAKQFALTLFEYQIRFLPMTTDEQKQQIEAQRKALGLDKTDNKDITCESKPR